jgi:hypothetical protein
MDLRLNNPIIIDATQHSHQADLSLQDLRAGGTMKTALGCLFNAISGGPVSSQSQDSLPSSQLINRPQTLERSKVARS